MRIKIKIQNEFYIWLNDDIEKTNQFSKRIQKNQKNKSQNWYKNKNNILIEGWNWKNNNFYKRAKKEIRNLNNEDQIEKYDTINLDWMMILKNNKTLTKGLRKKIKRIRIKL
jgi:hypothetical protein